MIESNIADERPPEKLINFPFIVQKLCCGLFCEYVE